MRIIEAIPYRTFKEKVSIVKSYRGKAKIEIYSSYIYVEHTKGAYN